MSARIDARAPGTPDFSHVSFISAGAGSGKTYRLTEELERALVVDGVDPARVIGTTFTVKAAAELTERVRERLVSGGRPQLAERMAQALIGTVHSVCERLLKRFAFELGLSPCLNVMSLEDGNRIFNQALDEVLDLAAVRDMNALALRLNQLEFGRVAWQGAVKNVADKIRENDVDLDSLGAMAADCADSLLAYFPAPMDTGDPLNVLRRTVEDALATIDPAFDTTKGTREYVERLARARHELRRDDCPWSVWIALSVDASRMKSEPIAATVRAAASSYAARPAFQADLRAYIEGVMTIAGRSVARFAELKLERGLIDFQDMERLTLGALDEPAVRARLADEIDLLMVDEFQDTNPMQLALFVKLARLAARVIFVGDVKQAIYAFRGCDPDLVFSALEGMASAKATTDVLDKSYRARPALMHYLNETFANAFAADRIPRNEVVLKPERPEGTDAPAVMSWTLTGQNQEEQARGLASGVSALVRERVVIVDPGTNEPRPVTWGDIAILARTNGHVEQIARVLKDRRVPMKMTLSGLLTVPEVCLARACLRRLNDPTDTLATAEILSLVDCAEPEAWLADRLRWVQRQNVQSIAWAEDDHPVVARLARLRRDSALRSPVEIVARVLNDVGTRRVATAWGPDPVKAAQRQRNLDAFLNLAVEYENHCESHFDAATLTGFLFWLEKPSSPELDLQPVVTTGDAVHVLTYHRAKGLEWPVVIATDFEYSERSSLWDVRAHLTADFDVLDPLANRVVRFWPDVFGNRTRGIPVLDAILDGPEGREVVAKSASEQRRLAYVGMTRARDLLVMSMGEKGTRDTSWLNAFASATTLPTGDVLQLEGGETVATSVATLDGTGEPRTLPPYRPRWFVQRRRRDDFVKETVSPSSAAPVGEAAVGRVIELGERIPINGADMTAIGNALHAIIAAEIVNPRKRDALERAGAILEAHGVDAFVKADDAVQAAARLRAAVDAQFKPRRLIAECPVVHPLDNGQVVRGWIDLLVETDGGWVVIDHKSSPRPRSEWAEEIVEYSGQLSAYREAVGTSAIAAGTWIHLPISAGIVECVPATDQSGGDTPAPGDHASI